MIARLKSTITIEALLASEGIALSPQGMALCPFHDDHHPSLSVHNGRYKCFACGAGGDIIDFVRKKYDMDINAAIAYLSGGFGVQGPDGPAVLLRKKRAAAIRAYREWERQRVDGLACLLWTFRQVDGAGLTFEETLLLAPLICRIPEIEYEYEILCGRDESAKIKLYQEAVNNGNG